MLEWKYISKGKTLGRRSEERTTPWRAPARLLVRLSPILSTSQQSGSHSIFDSNCLVSHYIPLNIGPISLLTRLAVTTESHWHSQSHSPLGPGPLHMCVCIRVCVKDSMIVSVLSISVTGNTCCGPLAATHWRLHGTCGLNWTISIDLRWYCWAWPLGRPIEQRETAGILTCGPFYMWMWATINPLCMNILLGMQKGNLARMPT